MMQVRFPNLQKHWSLEESKKTWIIMLQPICIHVYVHSCDEHFSLLDMMITQESLGVHKIILVPLRM